MGNNLLVVTKCKGKGKLVPFWCEVTTLSTLLFSLMVDRMNVGSSDYFAQISEYISNNPNSEQNNISFFFYDHNTQAKPAFPCRRTAIVVV